MFFTLTFLNTHHILNQIAYFYSVGIIKTWNNSTIYIHLLEHKICINLTILNNKFNIFNAEKKTQLGERNQRPNKLRESQYS